MKRLTVLGLSGLLIVALAAPVYAQIEWKSAGQIDANYFYYRNIFKSPTMFGAVTDQSGVSGSGSNVPSWNKSGLQYFNTRGRLKLDAAAGKEVTGTIYFEMDATHWGETGNRMASSGVNKGQNGMAGQWKGDQAAVEVKNLYFTFGVPYFGIPIPMTLKLGVQPVALRPEMVLATDGAGAVAGFKLDPVNIEAAWYKQVHDFDFKTANDSESFSLLGTAKISTLTLGAYGLLFNMRTYPFNKGSGDVTGANQLLDPSYKGRMYWFGAYADGKVGPLDMKADFAYDTGKVEPFGTQLTAEDVDYDGWAARLRLLYPWEMFEFQLLGMYASGPDARKTSTNGLPGSAVADGGAVASTKYRGYVIPPGSEENSSWGENAMGVVYGNFLLGRSPDFTGSSSSQLSRGGIGGTWTVQAKAGYKVAPWYKISLAGAYIGDTTKNGNTLGSAQKGDTVPARLRDDKTIGWEAALFNEINIYKNLKWDVMFAWLWAGKALDQWGVGDNVSPKDPYIAGTRLNFSW